MLFHCVLFEYFGTGEASHLSGKISSNWEFVQFCSFHTSTSLEHLSLLAASKTECSFIPAELFYFQFKKRLNPSLSFFYTRFAFRANSPLSLSFLS